MEKSEYGTGVLLSIHLTSNRPENIVPFFDNLEATASDHASFEVCLKIDDDDVEMNRVMEREAVIRPFRIRYISTPLPGGFWGLWRALNDLIDICDPDAYFLVNFNDEMVFLEPGWDEALAAYKGLYPDHIFRLRTSRFRFRNYRDYWECGYAPETSAFTTKRWIDIQGDWNACIGPDTFQQTVSHYVSRSNWPGQFQYNRDVPINDIKIGGEGAGLGMSEEQWRKWSRAAIRNWFHIMSHEIQTEASRRARLLQAHLFASNSGLPDYGVIEDAGRKVVELYDNEADGDRPIATFPYKLSRLRIGLTNWWRGFHYYYYGGGGPDVAKKWWTQQRIYLSLKYTWLSEPFEGFARRWREARYIRDRSGEGEPIASGNDASAVFNADTQIWWVSPERGSNVRNNAFVGCAFPEPVHVRLINLTQTSNKPFRQDRVRIERSVDGGETWSRVRSRPFFLRGTRSSIRLAASGPATHWRVMAAGRNATSELHAWTPIQVEMFEARSLTEAWAFLRGKAEPEIEQNEAEPNVPIDELVSPAEADDVLSKLQALKKLSEVLDAGDTQATGRAVAVLRRNHPDVPFACLADGHANMLAGNPSRAISAYEEGLELSPDDRELQLALLQARASAGIAGEKLDALTDALRVDETNLVFENADAEGAVLRKTAQEYGFVVLRNAHEPTVARELLQRAETHVYRRNVQSWRRVGARWNAVYPLQILDENSGPSIDSPAVDDVLSVGDGSLGLATVFAAPFKSALQHLDIDSADPAVFGAAGVEFHTRPIDGRDATISCENACAGGAARGYGIRIALAESGFSRPGYSAVPVPLTARFPLSTEPDVQRAILGISPRIVLEPGDAILYAKRSLFVSWSMSELDLPRVEIVLRIGFKG